MRSCSSYLKSFDAFGEPIGLNYDGESTFKTLLGAFVTIVIKSFLLVFATTQTIALMGYKDPTISQVSHLSQKLSRAAKFTYCLYLSLVYSIQSSDRRRKFRPSWDIGLFIFRRNGFQNWLGCRSWSAYRVNFSPASHSNANLVIRYEATYIAG